MPSGDAALHLSLRNNWEVTWASPAHFEAGHKAEEATTSTRSACQASHNP